MVHGSKSKSSQLGKTILLMDGWYGFRDPAYIAFLRKRRVYAAFMPPFTGLLQPADLAYNMSVKHFHALRQTWWQMTPLSELYTKGGHNLKAPDTMWLCQMHSDSVDHMRREKTAKIRESFMWPG